MKTFLILLLKSCCWLIAVICGLAQSGCMYQNFMSPIAKATISETVIIPSMVICLVMLLMGIFYPGKNITSWLVIFLLGSIPFWIFSLLILATICMPITLIDMALPAFLGRIIRLKYIDNYIISKVRYKESNIKTQ